MIRMAYVDTDTSGMSMTVPGAEGLLRADRIDPHGVVVQLAGNQLSIPARSLAEVGRFFLAAAVALGEDINEGWDGKP